jgi:hypothetical protein
MSIERTFYCDGPDCTGHVRTASPRSASIITVTEGTSRSSHFCTWDCLLKYAAAKPPVELVPLHAD